MSKTKNKPLNPKLPGRYGKMTAAQLSAESDRYDVPGVAEAEADAFARSRAVRPKHPKKRRPGRPAKPAADRAERVLITIEPALLRAADEFVKREQIGGGRSGWIQTLMRDAIAKMQSEANVPRKTLARAK